MLEKDCALKTIVDGDFTAKLLPEGYLSIRYKNYDCYGIAATEELDEEKEYYECPECGKPITEDMDHCPNCGVELSFEEEEDEEEAGEESDDSEDK